MIINPLAGIEKTNDVYDDEKITEVIQDFINKYPEIYVNATDPNQVSNEIRQILFDKGYKIPVKVILDNMFGYGIVEHLLEDEEITDIYMNNENDISFKKYGKIYNTNLKFSNKRKYKEYIKRVAIMNGTTINQNEAEVTFTDIKRGLRITASIPPVAIEPILHIRRPLTGQKLDMLVEKTEMLTQEQAEFLKEVIKKGKTIIIAGRGGSGKTTLLSSLVEEIPLHVRVGIVQEFYEIKTDRKNTVSRLTREGNNTIKEYTLFELIKNMLMLSIETMVVGELKDKETFDVINAIHTGHQALTTVHSPSADETLNRIIFLMKRANTDLSEEFLRQLLENSIDYIVYMRNYKVCDIFSIKEGASVRC